MLAKPWLSNTTTVRRTPSWIEVAISCAIIRYEPVADQRVDVAVGRRHLDAERGRDFVSHAGVAVFQVVLLRVARAPEFVQIARAGCRPR